MSRKERDRLRIIEQLDQRRLTQQQAAQILHISDRQVRRVLARWRTEGDAGLVHRSRGRQANNRLSEDLRQQSLALIREQYPGCLPTFVTEHLAADHGLVFSHETVRQWMSQERLWQPCRQHAGHRRQRPRRQCLGELAQMDTSIHDWLEGRGETGVLVLMIDDATSRVLMRFYGGDTTAANMDLLARWIAGYGRPGAIYVDWASHFRQRGKRRMKPGTRIKTQIERALGEMRIEMINAHSPQAKGRVERAFQTLQDRLVKELRLRKIRTLEQANRYLEETFIAWWNGRLAVAAASPVDAHRSAAGLDLEAILSEQQTRRVGNDYTIQWGGRSYQLGRRADGGRLAGQRVVVEARRDGSLRVRWGGEYLGVQRIERINPSVAAAAAGVEAPVGLRPPCASTPAAIHLPHHSKPSKDHPWKKRTFSLCRK